MKERSVMQGPCDIYLRYLTANGSGGRDGISAATVVLFKILETCDYVKPGRRKSVERETLTRKGQRELIKGAVRGGSGGTVHFK